MRGEIIKEINNHIISFYEVDYPNVGDKILKYDIDTQGNVITLYTTIDQGEKFTIKTIFKGFNKIKDIKGFQKGGYTSSNVSYYLRYFLDQIWRNIENDQIYKGDIIISKDEETNLNEATKILYLSYDDYTKIHHTLYGIKQSGPNHKKAYLSKFFGQGSDQTKKAETHTTLLNLSEWMVQYMTNAEKNKIEQIYQKVLDTGYQEQIYTIKNKIDLTYLDIVINEFEKKIENSKISEKQWGKFLKEKVFLLFGKYITCIDEIGIEHDSRRAIDFGMIDSQKFLDFYEIKKPNTELLSNTIDRGNYYWKNPTVKAIIQAEKYLYDIEENKKTVKKNMIKKLKKIGIETTFDLVRPRIYLLIGKSQQLNDDNKKKDFRILRNSLRNIEIILYDELLDQLRNIRKGLL